MKAFSDLVATALRCDLTRAVSLVWADQGGSAPYAMPFLNLGGSGLDIGEVHAIAHEGPDGYALKAKIDGWYMSQLSYLAQALDATAEGGGTALDNSSLIVMGNAQAEGSSHPRGRHPVHPRGRRGRRASHGAGRARRGLARRQRQLVGRRAARGDAQPAHGHDAFRAFPRPRWAPIAARPRTTSSSRPSAT